MARITDMVGALALIGACAQPAPVAVPPVPVPTSTVPTTLPVLAANEVDGSAMKWEGSRGHYLGVALALGDLDGDGVDEIVSRRSTSAWEDDSDYTTEAVMWWRGDATFGPLADVQQGEWLHDITFGPGPYGNLSNFGYLIVVGDITGDGRDDVMFGGAELPARIYEDVPTGEIPLESATIDWGAAGGFDYGDLDGDGDMDLGGHQIYLGSDAAGPPDPYWWFFDAYGNGFGARALPGNFDQDSDVELLGWTPFSDAERYLGVLELPPGGGQVDYSAPLTSIGVYELQAVGDLDADGVDDAVLTANNLPTLVQRSGGPELLASWTQPDGDNPTEVAVADVNLDGYDDLILALAVPFRIAIYEGPLQSGELVEEMADRVTILNWVWGQADVIAVGDVTGDGIPDVVVSDTNYRDYAGAVYLLPSGNLP